MIYVQYNNGETSWLIYIETGFVCDFLVVSIHNITNKQSVKYIQQKGVKEDDEKPLKMSREWRHQLGKKESTTHI